MSILSIPYLGNVPIVTDTEEEVQLVLEPFTSHPLFTSIIARKLRQLRVKDQCDPNIQLVYELFLLFKLYIPNKPLRFVVNHIHRIGFLLLLHNTYSRYGEEFVLSKLIKTVLTEY